MVTATGRPLCGAPRTDCGYLGMPGTERRIPELPRESEDGRGELVRESVEVVLESSDGADSWSPEGPRVRRPFEACEAKGCSPLPEPLDTVDPSRNKCGGALAIVVAGTPPGVCVPVPDDDRDGDPDGVDAAPYFCDEVELYESKLDIGR